MVHDNKFSSLYSTQQKVIVAGLHCASLWSEYEAMLPVHASSIVLLVNKNWRQGDDGTWCGEWAALDFRVPTSAMTEEWCAGEKQFICLQACMSLGSRSHRACTAAGTRCGSCEIT